MLLQKIVGALDAELERLTRLRTIVAGLQGSGVSIPLDQFGGTEPQNQVPESVQAQAPELPVVRLKSRRGMGRGRTHVRRRPTTPEQTALTGPIPNGPVVVSRATLAEQTAGKREQQAVKKEEPKPEPGSLGAMIRALHLKTSAS